MRGYISAPHPRLEVKSTGGLMRRPDIISARSVAQVFPFFLAAVSAGALDPGRPPNEQFDLTHWKLTLPTDRAGAFSGPPEEIGVADLAGGYHDRYFFTDPEDGSMGFKTPDIGATGGTSSHPRCELREMLPSGQQHNWKAASEGGTHRLGATCMVDSDSVGNGGQVCIGQIHAKDPNIAAVMLFYDNQQSQGAIRVHIKKKVTEEPGESHRFAPVGLNVPGTHSTKPIEYELQLTSDEAGHVVFTATVNGETWSEKVSAFDAHAWKSATFYFKAGSYYTLAVKGCGATVTFQSLVLFPATPRIH
jgi:hypothetical protein